MGPVLRLEIDGMRLQMMQHLMAHHEHIESEVNSKLKLIVSEFDYASVVNAAANKAIQESVTKAVSEYFSYGAGSKQIKRAIEQMLGGGE